MMVAMKFNLGTGPRKMFAARCWDIALWLCVVAALAFVVLMVVAFTPVS
ncbi:MAG: hypothetical protein KJZ58_08475 [Flavobacteriales bacterium]|nr:hypothetical protein [Flavobacteriales bacterium]